MMAIYSYPPRRAIKRWPTSLKTMSTVCLRLADWFGVSKTGARSPAIMFITRIGSRKRQP